MDQQRVRLRIGGLVQGVGFRPYVYRLARSLELGGFVRNDARGVLVEVEGAPDVIARFESRLPEEAPPLARCEPMSREVLAAVGSAEFDIVESDARETPTALVGPDVAPCDECLAELFDPSDRRYRYPFINCTNCGPRFSIVRAIPYDRPQTTMAAFPMCVDCQCEYDDPSNRRFHAQPNACARCGPRTRLVDSRGIDIDDDVRALAARSDAAQGAFNSIDVRPAGRCRTGGRHDPRRRDRGGEGHRRVSSCLPGR